ncbi:ankyrin repeat domain-containing protein 66 [Rhincodon typus]|uniref:ankyrin repeat domain-containing protein 66 n=1 Tax=Rhincodon typus TaxID=259920 RepID=UPI0020309FB8|nr:ankyrin repeat domain-containing protein 66 [Rhincodon typus]
MEIQQAVWKEATELRSNCNMHVAANNFLLYLGQQDLNSDSPRCDVNSILNIFNDPASTAVQKISKGKSDMVKLLITNGSRSCLRTETGWTAAHFAAESGKLSVLRMLHSLHAPIDKADLYGDTPRRIAEIYGQKDCVKFLEIAEQECSNYRRIAETKGTALDDTDEEWEIQKEEELAQISAAAQNKSNNVLDVQQNHKGCTCTVRPKTVTPKGKLSNTNRACKKKER